MAGHTRSNVFTADSVFLDHLWRAVRSSFKQLGFEWRVSGTGNCCKGSQPSERSRVSTVNYSDWRGIGTVVQHPDDAGVWIGGSAQLQFLGSAEAATTRGLPAALGEVSAVVSLCRVGTDEAPAIAAENHATFWLIDNASPAENAHVEFALRDAARAVARFRAEGHTVYLHCVKAESRTPTVAALYGVLLGGTALESLDRISRALPNAHPNGAFMKVLRG